MTLDNQLWEVAGIRPSLDLRFADTLSTTDVTTGTNPVDFTRASSGTYVGSDGLIKTALTDVPRFDHDPVTGESLGLLVEEERTNLLTYSEDFRNTADAGEPRPWSYSNSSITPNAVTAPDGSSTGDKLVESASTAWHYITGTPVSFSPQVYSFSIYAKAAERSVLQIVPNGSAFPSSYANFDLSAGTVSASNGLEDSFIIPVQDGWYRCVLVDTSTSSVLINAAFVACYDSPLAGRASSYTGDGTSGIYIWGAQVEEGAFPTSYIPTTSAAVTRRADVAQITGANFSSWYNASEGTVVVDAAGTNASAFNYAYTIDNNTATTSIRQTLNGAGTTAILTVQDGGATQASISESIASTNDVKGALAYKVNDFGGSINGSVETTDTSGTVPVVTQLTIGSKQDSTLQWNSTIRRLTYWPVRLNNSTLQELTSEQIMAATFNPKGANYTTNIDTLYVSSTGDDTAATYIPYSPGTTLTELSPRAVKVNELGIEW